jgi:hypothetical protein
MSYRILLFAWLWPVTPALAQTPPGYVLADAVSLPDSLIESYNAGSQTVVVIRGARTEFERNLLDQAERLLPLPDSIEAAAERFLDRVSHRGRWPQNFAEAAAKPGDRWWWYEFDEIWIPYALTGSAVEHLIERVRYLATHGLPYAESPLVSASLRYEATIDRAPDGGWVVSLTAQWRMHCGSLCGLRFTSERRVTFDPHGIPTDVSGDGSSVIAVS